MGVREQRGRRIVNGWVIDSDIPPPKSGHRHGGNKCKYPWEYMDVGDSIYVPECTANHISSVARNWAVRHQPKWEFTTVKESGGARCWRVK